MVEVGLLWMGLVGLWMVWVSDWLRWVNCVLYNNLWAVGSGVESWGQGGRGYSDLIWMGCAAQALKPIPPPPPRGTISNYFS